MPTTHQLNYVRNDVIEALKASGLAADTQAALADAIINCPDVQFIIEHADKPLVSYVDRYGGVVYDPTGIEVDCAHRGKGFDGIPGEGRRIGVSGNAIRITPDYVLHLVYLWESSDNYITPDGDLLDLEDTNDWYITLVADAEPALEW